MALVRSNSKGPSRSSCALGMLVLLAALLAQPQFVGAAPPFGAAGETVPDASVQKSGEDADFCGSDLAVVGAPTGTMSPSTREQAEQIAVAIGPPTADFPSPEMLSYSDQSAVLVSVQSARPDTVYYQPLNEGLRVFGEVQSGFRGSVASIAHSLACRRSDTTLSLKLLSNGGATLIVEDGNNAASHTIAPPWAFDEDGREIPIKYTINGLSLSIEVDASAATGRVIFDPTYSTLTCLGHYSTLNAAQYLDMYGASTDYGYCPVRGMMRANDGDIPIWGHENLLARTYGKVAVKNGGDDCSYGPETGLYWDFWVPCKAHDHCFDLRRGGFGGTVSEASCDDRFLDLMQAHCLQRSVLYQQSCLNLAAIYFAFAAAVSQGYTNGPVKIWNHGTSYCSTVQSGSTADFVEIDQWFCTNPTVGWQQFRVEPAGSGWFRIKPVHSGKCAMATFGIVYQSTCGGYAAELYRIQGALGGNIYSLRSQSDTNSCWHAQGTFPVPPGQDIDNPACNDYVSEWIWRISE